METYSVMRQFADTWGMLAMFLFFVGLVLYVVFGRRAGYRDAANSIFRNEDAPKDENSDANATQGDDRSSNEAR